MRIKRENNLETAIGYLDNLLSQISPDHPDYDKYTRAVNTAVIGIRVCQAIKSKKHKDSYKKNKKDSKNDSN